MLQIIADKYGIKQVMISKMDLSESIRSFVVQIKNCLIEIIHKLRLTKIKISRKLRLI